MLNGKMLHGQMLHGQMLHGQMLHGQMLHGQMLQGQMVLGHLSTVRWFHGTDKHSHPKKLTINYPVASGYPANAVATYK